MFATQPVCNAARAAHTLRSDQNVNNSKSKIHQIQQPDILKRKTKKVSMEHVGT